MGPGRLRPQLQPIRGMQGSVCANPRPRRAASHRSRQFMIVWQEHWWSRDFLIRHRHVITAIIQSDRLISQHLCWMKRLFTGAAPTHPITLSPPPTQLLISSNFQALIYVGSLYNLCQNKFSLDSRAWTLLTLSLVFPIFMSLIGLQSYNLLLSKNWEPQARQSLFTLGPSNWQPEKIGFSANTMLIVEQLKIPKWW